MAVGPEAGGSEKGEWEGAPNKGPSREREMKATGEADNTNDTFRSHSLTPLYESGNFPSRARVKNSNVVYIITAERSMNTWVDSVHREL